MNWIYNSQPLDEYGGTIQFEKKTDSSAIQTIYDDRIRQWDWNKNEELCKKHFGNSGQDWSYRKPEKIQEFLADYLGKQIELIRIVRYPNTNGWYNWRFDYIQNS